MPGLCHLAHVESVLSPKRKRVPVSHHPILQALSAHEPTSHCGFPASAVSIPEPRLCGLCVWVSRSTVSTRSLHTVVTKPHPSQRWSPSSAEDAVASGLVAVRMAVCFVHVSTWFSAVASGCLQRPCGRCYRRPHSPQLLATPAAAPLSATLAVRCCLPQSVPTCL